MNCIKYIHPLLFLSLCLHICYAVEGGDSYFGKEEGVCEGDSCGGPEESEEEVRGEDPITEEINIIITFTNAKSNRQLQEKFQLTATSLLHHTTVRLAMHIIGDPDSQAIAKTILDEHVPDEKKGYYRMVNLDVDDLARRLDDIVRPMQDHFSYKPGAYYNHALFFLSIAIHRVMPQNMDKVIMLDADLKFMADIRELHARFAQFTSDNVIGIARDGQPVYRHTFSLYRSQNKGTRVGDPPPDGLTGFNSGVLLLDLHKMRTNTLYNSLLNRESVAKLTEEFHFKGHLGDQDFFSLLLMRYEALFHVLPCQWNRQLCIWWKKHPSYTAIFDMYHDCVEEIKIYHGNCNTPIP